MSSPSNGACIGSVPRPTNLLGWLRIVFFRSSFNILDMSCVSSSLACQERINVLTTNIYAYFIKRPLKNHEQIP